MSISQELTLSLASYQGKLFPNGAPFPPSYPEKQLTLKDLWHLLRRRRATVFGTTALFLAIAIVICIFGTRRYSATAELQVQKEQSSPLGFESGVAGGGEQYSDASQDAMTLETQSDILQSDSLALKVIHDLNLKSTDDFLPKFNPIGVVMDWITPDGPSDAQLGPPSADDLGVSPGERAHLLHVFRKNLKVKPVTGTRLIDISYLSSNPRLAAEVANHLAQALSDYNFQTRHNATAKTADYLSGQLTDLRKISEGLQAKLAQAQRESGVLSLGGVDAQGRDQVYSTILDKLQQSTTAYTQAQTNRIVKGAIYEATRDGDPEAVSSLSGSTLFSGGGSGGQDSALALLQSLRLQEVTLEGQIAEAAAKFGTAYPKLQEMQKESDALKSSIQVEVKRMGDRAKNDYDVSQQVERYTRNVYEALKHQADVLNDKTIAYTLLRQEAEQSRTLFETLFKQLKQAGVLADFRLSNISVVDPARVSARPADPNVPLYCGIAAFGGLIVGCFAAFVRDSLDNVLHDMADVEGQIGQMPLAVLPFHKIRSTNLPKTKRSPALRLSRTSPAFGTDVATPEAEPVMGELQARQASWARRRGITEILALDEPRCAYTEALRALRTSLLLVRGGAPPKVILVTSSIAAEGKSLLSLNLAGLLAQQGKKVLLIDADLRRPTVHRNLGISSQTGLSSYLTMQNRKDDGSADIVQVLKLPTLFVLPGGPAPPYPAELLGSLEMQAALNGWKEQFDFIVIDSSPVLPVTDSVILSAQADFTLLVARYNLTQRQSLDRSFGLLKAHVGSPKIGVIFNAIRQDASAYYQYYGYSNSAYYGSHSEAKV
jgi:capsular exopolysaccharide synthesis family protein